MTPNLISLKNLSLKENYNNKCILDDISFNISEQDFITIIGPNGAGKTSLLKIILGIKKQTKGVLKKSDNLKIGYLPQKINLENIIPINVEYFLNLNQSLTSDILEKNVNLTNIAHLLNHKLYELSGGELQKILLCKALLNQPNLLILDEPDQNLDISGQIEFYELINKIYQTNKTAILMVSHNLHMVMSSSKQVICLYHHICCKGKPEKIVNDPEFISLFGKNMNKILSIYNHSHNHKHG